MLEMASNKDQAKICSDFSAAQISVEYCDAHLVILIHVIISVCVFFTGL